MFFISVVMHHLPNDKKEPIYDSLAFSDGLAMLVLDGKLEIISLTDPLATASTWAHDGIIAAIEHYFHFCYNK